MRQNEFMVKSISQVSLKRGNMKQVLTDRLCRIKLLAMDVDGVLTDGGIHYDEQGNEWKRFDVTDGLGLHLLRLGGIKTAWITGRTHAGVKRRSEELKIDYLLQGAGDKRQALAQISELSGVDMDDIGYIGDDWNDLPAYEIAGCRFAPSSASLRMKEAADMVTAASGGSGAVREVCELILNSQHLVERVTEAYIREIRKSGIGAQ